MSETLITNGWTKPSAMALPKEGYFKKDDGRYGPVYPQTPADYGFTITVKVKPGREDAVRAYPKTIEDAVRGRHEDLAPLKLHCLRSVLFDVGCGSLLMN